VGSLRRLPLWARVAAPAAAVAIAVGLAVLFAVPGRSGSSAPTVERLPDLEQRSPYALSGETVRTPDGPRFRLGFGSAVDNVGIGPLLVIGRRIPGAGAVMDATQIVRGSDGSGRRYPHIGTLRYTLSTTHQHWHLLRFDRYELRTVPGDKLLRPDRKTGFCLGDRYQTDATTTLEGEPPAAVWTEECGKSEPLLASVREGISVGYGDNYDPLLEGQYLDLTGLPAGRYELVHRVNADRRLLESNYANNAASVLISLTWPRGHAHEPRIDVVARCGDGRRCNTG
jgi:hypothetical protein